MAALVRRLRPHLEVAGDAERVEAGVERVVCAGTGAARQRAASARSGTMDEVGRSLVASVLT